MDIVEKLLTYFKENTATVLLVVAILYFVVFFFNMYRSNKTGQGFTIHWRFMIAFIIIIILAIYCLITGQDLSSFIN